MKHQLIISSLAIAAANAANIHRHHHAGRRHDEGNNVVWVTEVEVRTVVDWQTFWGNGAHGAQPTPHAANLESAGKASDAPGSIASVSTTSILANSIESVAAGSVATAKPSSVSPNAPSGIEDISATSTNELTTATADSVAASATAPSFSGETVGGSGNAIGKDNLSPNGRKAGLSGYVGIQQLDAFSDLAPYISWYSDYTPNTPTTDNVTGIGMLWGANGSPCGSEVSQRLSTFKNSIVGTTPDFMFGFYEPDCYCADSSNMDTASGTSQWNELIAPLGKTGTVLGSPSMCKQKDETWLGPFRDGGLDHDWDVTSVHINKPDLAGIKEDIEYYASTYKKPIWVSEFACVHDQGGWSPCTDQGEIDQFINDAVKFFEGNDTVVAYGPSNGNGLGNVWPLTDASGELTASGTTYLNALKNL